MTIGNELVSPKTKIEDFLRIINIILFRGLGVTK
jgi:hypothetical protein